MKTLDLDAILQKKNSALNDISDTLDKAITKVYNTSKYLSDETKSTLESCKTDLKGASKEKIDSVIDRLQKLSEKLTEEEKEAKESTENIQEVKTTTPEEAK